MPVYSFRLEKDHVDRLDAIATRQGVPRVAVLRDMIESYGGDASSLMSELLNLYGVGAAAKFELRADADGQLHVTGEIVPDATGGTFGATSDTPLTQHVEVDARPAGAGRAAIEIAGYPHTPFAGVRVPVATVPFMGAEVTVRLLDLHPASQEEPRA